MGIDNDTLETWASYETGAIDSAQTTQERIRNVLEDVDSDLYEKYDDYETFLQGSYRNYTLIRGDSDVDIVVCLHDIYYSDIHELSKSDKEQYERNRSTADVTWSEFRNDVIDRLEDAYGTSSITEGDKALEVETSALPLPADVVVTAENRHYLDYPTNYIEGIAFWPQNGSYKITNYPKQHIENGATKQSRTNNRFKETVRIFKRARNAADDEGYLDKSDAPSYFIECLLYNTSNSSYVNDRQERYLRVIDDLANGDFDEYLAQNGRFYLFGNSSTQWDQDLAVKYLNEVFQLGEDW